MRRQCHWLVLGASLVAVAGVLLLTEFRSPVSLAEGSSADTCLAARDSYHSPQCCAECHPEKYQSWSQTAHASARVDPIFDLDLQGQESPGDCLCCHTTGYDPNSGHYALPGVTCEACHEPYQPGHTAAQMQTVIASPELICKDCHVDRYTEWAAGAHGETDEHCASCHTIHS